MMEWNGPQDGRAREGLLHQAALRDMLRDSARARLRLPRSQREGHPEDATSPYVFASGRPLDRHRNRGDRGDGSLRPFAGSDAVGHTDGQGRVTVVVCDELPVFALGLARLLEEESPSLRVTGVEVRLSRAKHMIGEKRPAVTLIGLGSDHDGELQTVREICTTFPGTRVVLLVPDADATGACEALAGAGVAGYTVKNRDAREIAEVVSLVARGHNVAPAAAGLPREGRREADSLDDVERDILRAVARSETNRQLAVRLHLSERTVSRRLEAIYMKLDLADRLQAAVYAAVNGLVTSANWRPEGGAAQELAGRPYPGS